MASSQDECGGGQPVLRVAGISKAFGHVQALDCVDLELYAGEILALIGDNGAGKSTLVKILSGVYQPDEGEIYVDGQRVDIRTPTDAQRLGLATVFQDLALVNCRDVASNIYLGIEPMQGIVINRRKMWEDAEKVLRTLRINMPSVRVDAGLLSGGQRQAVAVARALARGNRIFILDEPTAALGVEESRKVLELVQDLSRQGSSVIVVSHNMLHVFEVAHRMLVLRHGRNVGVRRRSETTPDEIVALITGASEVATPVATERELLSVGKEG